MKQSLGNEVYNLLREAHKCVHEAQRLLLSQQALETEREDAEQLGNAVDAVSAVLYLAEGEAARIGNPL
jgi:hypothetical protein